jgi:hypothetical protein
MDDTIQYENAQLPEMYAREILINNEPYTQYYFFENNNEVIYGEDRGWAENFDNLTDDEINAILNNTENINIVNLNDELNNINNNNNE